jgi:signal transduction histidine kinase
MSVSYVLLRYFGVVLLVAAVVALKMALWGDLLSAAAAPFRFFTVATMLAAWYAGRGGAAMAVMLSVLGASYFTPPVGSFAVAASEFGNLFLFALELSLAAALTLGFLGSRTRSEVAAGELEQARRQLQKENRAYRALSAASEIVLRARGEDELLRALSDAVVTVAGYRMAWIGRAEDDASRSVRPVAHAGFEDGYLESAKVTWADDEHGRGPVGTAIRSGRPAIQRDVVHDPEFAPWREEAIRRGYGSCIGLPIRIDSRIEAAFAVYASEADGFDADEVKLLEQLAAKAAFAVATLRARAAAEQADRQREEFVRIVSHELRTPLTALVTWAQALQVDRGRDPERLSRGLEAILRSAREEASLIEDLLLASSVLRGELQLYLEPLGLDALVRSCVDELRPKAEERGVALEMRVAHASRTRVDRELLRQSLSNVLSNAIKFTPSGGEVHVDLSLEEGEAVIRVRDTGKGIAPADLPHVFDLLRCGDASTTRKERGIGAGLFIARAVVEAHGGAIRAESEGVGRGSTIVMRLPAPARAT